VKNSFKDIYVDSLKNMWLSQVISYNETLYNQKVYKTVETGSTINLIFEDDVIVTDYTELDEKNMAYSDIKILSVEYLKPEIAKDILSEPMSLPNKIITYYGWSNGYVTLGTKTGPTYLSIANLALTYTPISSKLVSWVVSEAVSEIFTSFDRNRPVTAETKNKYYYQNKAGAVYVSNQWLPVAYVGSRRSFAWSWASVYNYYGEPIVDQNGPKNGNNSTNPTNYDSIETKPHFYDNLWIVNKALETYQTGGYWDAFGLAYTPLN